MHGDSMRPGATPEFPGMVLDKCPEISVVIPARNEEANLGDCLQSLVGQRHVRHEIIVVDDGSTDRTRQIAESFSGVRVIGAGPLEPGWTGKNNALRAGASQARGEWLLFTDADTIHQPNSLRCGILEALRTQVDLLSYSPKQIVGTIAERIVMPMVFAELAAEYPPQKVRDEKSGVVAANGQYLLVRREAYDSVGGHAAVASEILEDVELAKAFRRGGFRIHFRYGGDCVRTRMYRGWRHLRDGWTKNLALLFPRPWLRASLMTTWWLIVWLTLLVPIAALALLRRIERANFDLTSTLLAFTFGPPVFAYLLVRSHVAHTRGLISWKGRSYSRMPKNSFAKFRELTTDN